MSDTVHKKDFAKTYKIRSIFAAYATPSYPLAKYLVPILNPLTTNEFTVQNSYSFVEELLEFKNTNNLYMMSFDIENLFTNIPLDETISIALDGLFKDNDTVQGMNKIEFKKFLELSVKNCFFQFNGKFYEQLDGLGMGLPLGPTFANLFLL